MHTLQHTYINKVIADMYVKRLGRFFFFTKIHVEILYIFHPLNSRMESLNIDVNMFDEGS